MIDSKEALRLVLDAHVQGSEAIELLREHRPEITRLTSRKNLAMPSAGIMAFVTVFAASVASILTLYADLSFAHFVGVFLAALIAALAFVVYRQSAPVLTPARAKDHQGGGYLALFLLRDRDRSPGAHLRGWEATLQHRFLEDPLLFKELAVDPSIQSMMREYDAVLRQRHALSTLRELALATVPADRWQDPTNWLKSLHVWSDHELEGIRVSGQDLSSRAGGLVLAIAQDLVQGIQHDLAGPLGRTLCASSRETIRRVLKDQDLSPCMAASVTMSEEEILQGACTEPTFLDALILRGDDAAFVAMEGLEGLCDRQVEKRENFRQTIVANSSTSDISSVYELSLARLCARHPAARTLLADRLRHAWTTRRTWKFSDFRRIFMEHSGAYQLASTLIWSIRDDDFVDERRLTGGQLVGLDGRSRHVSDAATIWIARGSELDQGQRAAWGDVMARELVIAPFDQLFK